MYINELAEPQLLVIYPGRFQPFHKGHHAVYEWLTGKFGRNNVYIATSNKTDAIKSPFTFAEKAYFMQLTGVPADRIVQAAQPYKVEDVLAGGHITVANPANTVVIFAVSQKDMDEDPRFSFAPRKDGSPAYFQKFTTIKQTESMNQHGYIMTVPTFDFTVAGSPMRSGTELRKLYTNSDQKQRQAIIADLFGKYTSEAEQILNHKLAPAAPATGTTPVAETTSDGYYKLLAHRYRKDPRLLSTKEKEQLHNYIIQQKVFKEDAAGVGVVKGSNDPRYVMATAGDQNDVNGATLGKGLRAFGLTGRTSPGGKTQQYPVGKNIGKGGK
jgi:cytidyltransferase-like protein